MMKQETKEKRKENNRDIQKKTDRHREDWENKEHPFQKKGKRKASKLNTPVEICPFTSILLFCQFVVMEGHCSLLVFFHFYIPPSSLLRLFCLSYELSICCLVEGAEPFSFSLSYSLGLLEKVCWKELIIGWHSSCFSVSWSFRLPHSLSCILALFFGLSLTPSSSII